MAGLVSIGNLKEGVNMKYNINLKDFAVQLGNNGTDKDVCDFIEVLMKEIKDTPLSDKIYSIVTKEQECK